MKDYELSKVRTALDLQKTNLSTVSRETLAESIVGASAKYSLDPMLVLAVIKVESCFDHQAVSPRGAQGLMQVQPTVVTALIEQGKMSPLKKHDNIKDPLVNVVVGVSYLAHMKDLFGDLTVALTAYNSGPTWVSKKIAAKEALPLEYASQVLTARRSLENQLASLDGIPTRMKVKG